MFLLNIVIECAKNIIVGTRPFARVLSASGGLHDAAADDFWSGGSNKLPFCRKIKFSREVNSMKYPRLFSPITIRGHEIPNRVVLAPMGMKFNNHDGSVTARYVNYIRARARGGAGLLLTENTHLLHEYTQGTSMGAYHDRLISGLSRLPHAAHPFGAKIIMQISIHGGTAPERTIGRVPFAPSAVESPMYPQVPRELSLKDIENLIDTYVQGAWRAWRAGYDGVEVHGAHGYLITQFVSPHTNHRDDAYGGDFARRMRFPSEIVRRIRDVCDDDFIIGFKYNGYENVPDGIDPALAVRIGCYMEQSGVDYLHVASLGGPMNIGDDPRYPVVPSLYSLEHNPLLELAEQVKAEVAVPVIAAGGFNRPEDAEAAINKGAADLVAVGRAYLADDAWGFHARNGRPEDIRPCLKCNQCHIVLQKAHVTRCAINPALGEMDERDLGRSDHPKRVVVVGSGPGGLEAAITAAFRGHQVTLCEKENVLGGNLRIGSIPFFKEDYRRYYDYILRRLERSDVETVLSRKADNRYLKALAPDVVIIATGSKMIPLNLPGGGHVLPVVDVLAGRVPVGDRVLVVGAGPVGCEAGWHLANEGRQVTVVDTLAEENLLAHEHPVNRVTLLHQLRNAGVTVVGGAVPKQITETEAVVKLAGGDEKVFPVNTVVSSVGFKPCRALYRDLLNDENPWEVYAVGDCVKVENFYHAVQGAFQLARHI